MPRGFRTALRSNLRTSLAARWIFIAICAAETALGSFSKPFTTAAKRSDSGGCSRPNSTARGKRTDRKSTRLNSSHLGISYAVFCLKKKKNIDDNDTGIEKRNN